MSQGNQCDWHLFLSPLGISSDHDNWDPTRLQECVTLANPDGGIFFLMFLLIFFIDNI